MDALDLARWQFAITTVYHFLFVPLTVGLSTIVAVLQTAWHRTGRVEYLRATRFLGKLFLINFAMGVVTGIVQEFQFGMNWSEYSTYVGDVFGAPLAMEALLAFFLESTFIGLWIFGWDKLPRRVHLATIWATAIGTNISSYFILTANAWMRHPVGYTVEVAPDGTRRARLTDLWAVLSNDQAWSTYLHVTAASFLTAGLFVVAVAAYKLMRERWPGRNGASTPADQRELFRRVLRVGLVTTAIAGAVVALSGHHQARLMVTDEPMKLAAAEGLWRTERPAGFSLFAVGDVDAATNFIDIRVPSLLSWLATNSTTAEVTGMLDLQQRFTEQFGPGDYIPNVPVLYWSFRLMIGLGVLGIAIGLVGLWLTRRGRLPNRPWTYQVAMLGLPAALAADIFGWILTEVGRQPWTVVGELLTAASVSPGVSLGEVALSLTLFTLVYGVLAVVEAWLLWRYVKAGPAEETPAASPSAEREDQPVPAFTY